MNEPILSFVVPVYKKPPEVFEKCLASLFDCSLKDIEVIAVFDGPNEELELVAKRYPKVQVHTIEHGGAPKARNYGLDLAKGKYVCFWDSDCYIKPDGPKRWVQEFESTNADFVYFGYEVAGEGGEFTPESFNPYSLQCGNYVSTMSPIKRDKAPKWDETLPAAQDWDYFLTAVEQGLKGVWIEGAGFVTDKADRNQIDRNVGLASDKREDIITQIRAKHNIPDRSVGVYSASYHERAIKLAQILGADVIKPTGRTPAYYKTIVNLGYNFMSRWEGIPEDTKRVQYWIPGEIEGLKHAKYSVVMETIRIAKKTTNYCNTPYEKNKLEELGIEAEILPLPLAEADLAKVQTKLPEKFSVLVATDQAYSDLLKDLAVDLPHIEFLYKSAAKVEDFSCFLSFYQFAALDNAMLVAQVNGRHVISNVQAPYCGFIDPDQSWEKFKKELYAKIAEAKNKAFNQEAQTHYLEFSNPKAFKEAIEGLSKTLEVL